MPVLLEKIVPAWRRELTGRRAVSLALVILVHILGLLLALALTPPLDRRRAEPEFKNFRLLPLSERKEAARAPTRQATATPTSSARTPPLPKPPIIPPSSPLQMMIIDSDVFAAGDISKIPSHRADGAGQGMAQAGEDEGTGEAPGGGRLYAADWYVEPTNAEMAYYMPKGAPRAGWGMIACRTVPDFRVEDCRELGESPQGSGLARAVRQAAWQFRVRPPRIGGKSLVGAWVRIRFDLTLGVVK